MANCRAKPLAPGRVTAPNRLFKRKKKGKRSCNSDRAACTKSRAKQRKKSIMLVKSCIDQQLLETHMSIFQI